MTLTLERRPGAGRLPANERALVDELSGVLRRHREHGPATLARLLNVAFDRSLGTREPRAARLARAVMRGMETRQQLAEAEGGSLSSEEVARMLRISKTAVLKRLAAGRLLAWREERLQAARFPRWQFNEHGEVLAGFTDVLAILQQDERLNAWGKVLFFLQGKGGPVGRRPLDWLREGKLKEACRAARAYAE